MDDAPVRRLRLVRGDQRALQVPAPTGPDGALGRLRPADPARPTTPTTSWPAPRWAGSAWRSTPLRTWRRSSTACRSTGCRSTSRSTPPPRSCSPCTSSPPSARASRRGRLAGTLQNDILKEFLARKLFVFPPAPSMRLAADVVEYSAEQLPRFNPISITGYHAREAGCDADPGARPDDGRRDRLLRGARRPRPRLRPLRAAAVLPLRHDARPVRGGGQAARGAAVCGTRSPPSGSARATRRRPGCASSRATRARP